ncbi:MAG: BlaI/MecI/CopY family transcriptional regulator [Candidatus Saccharimonas sp.]|nr:BlaI/MecI/CopY family transcriptional regulator [Planctomycetaceae bacterium]
MARPKQPHPTPGELEILRILWERGPSTVREVLELVPQERAYTSVMSLLTVMADKKLVTRKPEGRAFRYTAKLKPGQTEGKMLGHLLDRVFDGSTTALVARLLEQSKPSPDELDEIRRLIDEYKQKDG